MIYVINEVTIVIVYTYKDHKFGGLAANSLRKKQNLH
jgi:hypothetical protein